MKLITIILLLLTISLSTAKAESDIFYTQKDIEIFNDYISKFHKKHNMEMNKIIAETGKYFVGTPYVNFVLERVEPEALIVNFRELDCVTFVETVVALAQTIKSPKQDFATFCTNLRTLRFRDGKNTDFTYRYHYLSDWIHSNEKAGRVKDLTLALGGISYACNPKVMSRYPGRYRQLVANPDFVPIMSVIEDTIAARKLYSIPEEEVQHLNKELKSGYIIGTTTDTSMDLAHCGFIYKIDGVPYFMHASSDQKAVVITELTMYKYLKDMSKMIGIMVVKAL